MRQTIIEALTWALELDPAALKWPAAVLVALCFGLVLFGLVQYQAFNRLWGIHLVLGLAGGAVVVGLGAAIHWLLGVLYGVGYVLAWLAWVLTRRWRWWRRALVSGLAAGLALGPWLWIGATEKRWLPWWCPSDSAQWLVAPSGLVWFWMMLGALWLLVGGWGCWRWPLPAQQSDPARPWRRRWLVAAWAVLGVLGLNWYAAWLVAPSGPAWFWMMLGALWLLVLVGGWGCWRWPLPAQQSDPARPWRRRWLVAAWAMLGLLGLNWYAAGRVELFAACRDGQHWRLAYVLVSRPGSQWHRNASDWTPLHVAALNGKTGALRLLLAAGADVNAKDAAGETPLHLAAVGGNVEAVGLLLAAGADVNAKDKDGGTPLQLAAWSGNAEALRLLLAAGADVNAKDKDKDGGTPLHWAARYGKAEALRVLLAASARVNDRNANGTTALDMAKDDECREVLRQAGGKTGAEMAAPPAPTP